MISINDFDFEFAGYGHYKVTYTSPKGKSYTATISDMRLIDATKNEVSPKKIHLNDLKKLCKQ